MINGVSTGIAYFKEGFRLIRQPRLRLFVVIPVILNLLLFSLLAYSFGRYFSGWVDQAVAWLPDWLDLLAWLLWLVFALLLLLLWVYGFVFLANLIGSPFYGLLSERVEELLTGVAPDNPLTLKSALLLVPQSIWRELQKLFYYLPRFLGILILGFVPVAQAGAPFLSLAFSAWMMSLQFADYPADNHGVSFPRMRRLLAQQRVACGSFGGLVFLATLIPVVNLFAMPAAVAGATALWVRELQPLRKDR